MLERKERTKEEDDDDDGDGDGDGSTEPLTPSPPQSNITADQRMKKQTDPCIGRYFDGLVCGTPSMEKEEEEREMHSTRGDGMGG